MSDDALLAIARAIALGQTLTRRNAAQMAAALRPEAPATWGLAALADSAHLAAALLGDAPRLSKLDPLRLLVAVHLESDAVDAQIDRAIAAGDAQVVNALARAGIPWEHDAMAALLEVPACCAGAAQLLAITDLDALSAWALSEPSPPEAALADALRAVAQLEEVDLSGLIAELRDACDPQASRPAQRLRDQLDALRALLDPERYARQVLMDELELSWLRLPSSVADLLILHGGESSWRETLAILETAEAMTAFELAALIAVTAASSLGDEAPDGVAQAALLDLMAHARDNSKEWEARAITLALRAPLAFGDEDTAPMLAEAAAHERLVQAQAPSPGILGLPLSATDAEGISCEAAYDLLDGAIGAESLADEQVVTITRTLCDLRRWHRDAPDAVHALTAEPRVLHKLAEHAHPAIHLAARHALASVQRQAPGGPVTTWREALALDAPARDALDAVIQTALGESMSAWLATTWLAALPLPDALHALSRVWAQGALARSAHTQGLMLQRIATP